MKSKHLIIIGAGSLGIMTLDAALELDHYHLISFIDDGKELSSKVYGKEVIGRVKDLENYKNQHYDFVIAIANNNVRKEIAEKYNLNYVNIIHPKAVVSKLSRIKGVGNIILPNVSIDPETIIHNHVIVNKNTSLGHNAVLNDYSQVSPGSQLGGIIGEGAFIGLGATVLPNVQVGRFSTIGAGSVVNRHILEHTTAIGVPAKVLVK